MGKEEGGGGGGEDEGGEGDDDDDDDDDDEEEEEDNEEGEEVHTTFLSPLERRHWRNCNRDGLDSIHFQIIVSKKFDLKANKASVQVKVFCA